MKLVRRPEPWIVDVSGSEVGEILEAQGLDASQVYVEKPCEVPGCWAHVEDGQEDA